MPRTHIKGERRKLTPKVCPLTSACAPWYTCSHSHSSCVIIYKILVLNNWFHDEPSQLYISVISAGGRIKNLYISVRNKEIMYICNLRQVGGLRICSYSQVENNSLMKSLWGYKPHLRAGPMPAVDDSHKTEVLCLHEVLMGLLFSLNIIGPLCIYYSFQFCVFRGFLCVQTSVSLHPHVPCAFSLALFFCLFCPILFCFILFNLLLLFRCIFVL